MLINVCGVSLCYVLSIRISNTCIYYVVTMLYDDSIHDIVDMYYCIGQC